MGPGAASFLPHGLAGGADDARQPILLSTSPDAPNLARNMLIADGEWRDAALTFDRSFYLFDDDDARRRAARVEAARRAGRGRAPLLGAGRRPWKSRRPEPCRRAPARLGGAANSNQPITGDRPVMAATRTFSIIKPDATRRNLTGAVTKMLEDAGLRVVASKRIHMTRDQAEGFYAVHKERPFFNDLCTFMTSGPVVVQVLEGENAVQRNRDVMGATNPADAAEGTIRKALPNRSRPIRSTARTATRMPRSRSTSSSSRKRSSASDFRGHSSSGPACCRRSARSRRPACRP